MIGLTDIDLKQTRFYRYVFAEGQQAGFAEGYKIGFAQGFYQGLSQGANQLLLWLIRSRFGALPEWVEDKLSQASTRQKEQWSVRILDAPSLKVLFAQSGG